MCLLFLLFFPSHIVKKLCQPPASFLFIYGPFKQTSLQLDIKMEDVKKFLVLNEVALKKLQMTGIGNAHFSEPQ